MARLSPSDTVLARDALIQQPPPSASLGGLHRAPPRRATLCPPPARPPVLRPGQPGRGADADRC